MENLRKICASSVPYCLTDEKKALRLEACQEFIQSVHDDCSLLDSVETGDQTWYFQYDPQAIRQSMEWRTPSSPKHKKNSISKLKKQSDAGHILQKTGNHLQKICSTRADGE